MNEEQLIKAQEVWQTWSYEDVDAGESDSESSIEDRTVTVQELRDLLETYSYYSQPLRNESLENVWVAYTQADPFSGDEVETSLHLVRDQSDEVKSIWTNLLRERFNFRSLSKEEPLPLPGLE